jgi:TonB family protein
MSVRTAARIPVFLLLFMSSVTAQTSPDPQLAVTGASLDWLAPAIAATSQCRAPSQSDTSLAPPPHQLGILFQAMNPKTRNVALLSSSGNSSFDQRAVTCFRSLAPASSANLRGPNTFVIWVLSNNGAIALDPGKAPRWLPTPLGSRQCAYPAGDIPLIGATTVGFNISREGTVSDVQILQSSGDPDFDTAAIKCADQWRYAPPAPDNTPIELPWKAMIKWAGPPDRTIGAIFDYGIHCAMYQLSAKDLEGVSGPTVIQLNVKYGRDPDVGVKISSGNEILDKRANDCFSHSASHWLILDGFTTNKQSVVFDVNWK